MECQRSFSVSSSCTFIDFHSYNQHEAVASQKCDFRRLPRTENCLCNYSKKNS